MTRKIVPAAQITSIAHAPKGLFFFKTNARNQFYPYELLNYSNNPTIILPLRRTSTGMQYLLNQHGFNATNVHFIDIVSKHISSSLEHKQTKYLQHIDLNDLHDAIESYIDELGSSPKTIIIDDFHTLIPHHGDLKTRRFLDRLHKRMEQNFTKTIVLADNTKLPKEVSKYLFNSAEHVVEIPK